MAAIESASSCLTTLTLGSPTHENAVSALRVSTTTKRYLSYVEHSSKLPTAWVGSIQLCGLS